ncbi:MAG: T9SS type A sorting domain-containing protein, partial [Bacteroidia bacterium]|nr:T9SS type A sorting domain-containing protein [Bacteroidia bacterium]
TDPSGCNTLTWRWGPIAVNRWDGEDIKPYATLITPPPCFPLCEAPETPSITASGATTICQGQSLTLTSTFSGHNEWYLDGNLIAGQNGNTIVVSQPGIYTVRAANYSCRSDASNGVQVTVLPIPAPQISGLATVCENTTATYSVNLTPGNSYDWVVTGGAFLSGVGTNEITVLWASSGNGQITVIESAPASSCATSSNPYNVTVNPLPSEPIITQNGPDLIAANGENYQWLLNGVEIPGATSETFTPTTTGYYSVINTNSCGSDTSETYFFQLTDVKDLTKAGQNIIVYPNPYIGYTTLSYEINEPTQTKIEVLNMLGQKMMILAEGEQKPGKYQYEFSARKNGLPAGAYLIRVQLNNREQTIKVIELK